LANVNSNSSCDLCKAGTSARCWHAMHNGASTWNIMLVPEASLMHFLSKGVCIVCTHGQTHVWSLVQVRTHVQLYTSSAQRTPLKLHTALLGSAHAESGRPRCSPAAQQCPLQYLPGKAPQTELKKHEGGTACLPLQPSSMMPAHQACNPTYTEAGPLTLLTFPGSMIRDSACLPQKHDQGCRLPPPTA